LLLFGNLVTMPVYGHLHIVRERLAGGGTRPIRVGGEVMGWGRWLLLGDLGQQMDLADQQAEIERLREKLQSRQAEHSSAEQRLVSLERENDELKLYLATVVRLLLAKKVATAEEMRALVAAVDREDGAEDKRYAGPIVPEA
jgi:chromosome segregation ATPase